VSDLVAFLRARLDEDEAVAQPWAPPRWLREVEAKRAIIAEYEAPFGSHLRLGLYFAIVQLAAIWHDHPDYDPAWSA
jgi:Family of unknown function (DUF6221)